MKKKRNFNYFCTMYSISYLLDTIKGEDPDKLLEYGMFRNGRKIFTTNFLQFDHVLYSALWLRIYLPDFELSEKQALLHKKNSKFEVKYSSFTITEEKEKLYQEYRAQTMFKGIITLEGLLNDYTENNVYESNEICIYDNGKLIGCGIYDKGENSCAGIVSFFDANYKKHSLGKYLILLKIIKCKEKNFTYFYPGYFAPGYPAFDYKLDFAKNCTEYLNIKYNTWLNTVTDLDYNELPISRMYKKLDKIATFLNRKEIEVKLMFYFYFDSNIYVNFGAYEPLTSPYIIFFKQKALQNYVLTYDLFKSSYVLLEIHRFEHSMILHNIPNTFDKHLLIISNINQQEFIDEKEIVDYLMTIEVKTGTNK